MSLAIAGHWFEWRTLTNGVTAIWEPHVKPFYRCNIWLVRGRDVDAVAMDVVADDDDIAEVDADAELDALFRRGRAIAGRHARLDRDGAADRLDRAGEVHQQAVAGAFDDASPMLGDARFDQRLEMRVEPVQRPFLVLAHQPAVAGDVGRQDRRELALGAGLVRDRWLVGQVTPSSGSGVSVNMIPLAPISNRANLITSRPRDDQEKQKPGDRGEGGEQEEANPGQIGQGS